MNLLQFLLKLVSRHRDFFLSLIAMIFCYQFFAKYQFSNAFAKDIYGVAISVLSIIFSVYFASMAIILSSGDNDFLEFLIEHNTFERIVKNIKAGLTIIFASLMICIVLYIVTAAWIDWKVEKQPFFMLLIFLFVFLYGMLAALETAKDSIRYTLYRGRFLALQKQKQQQNQNTSLDISERKLNQQSMISSILSALSRFFHD